MPRKIKIEDKDARHIDPAMLEVVSLIVNRERGVAPELDEADYETLTSILACETAENPALARFVDDVRAVPEVFEPVTNSYMMWYR